MAKLFSAVHTHLDPFGVRETPEGAVSEGFTAGDYVLLRVTAYLLVQSVFSMLYTFPFLLLQLQVKEYLEKRCGVDEESADEFRAMLDPANSKYCPWPPTEWAEQEAALAAAASDGASADSDAANAAARAAASAADPPASGQDEENRLRERSDDNAPYNAMFQ
jgi:hypothetical protein